MDTEKITVTERALLARLNRHLAKDGRKLHRHRQTPSGRYFITDGQRVIERECAGLESIGRRLGVLRQFEVLENRDESTL